MIYGTQLLLQIHHDSHLFLSSSCDREITIQRCFLVYRGFGRTHCVYLQGRPDCLETPGFSLMLISTYTTRSNKSVDWNTSLDHYRTPKSHTT